MTGFRLYQACRAAGIDAMVMAAGRIPRPVTRSAKMDKLVLTLQGIGASQITVQNNVTNMMDKITLLMEAVNYAKSYIQEQTKFSGAKLTPIWNENTQMFERGTESGKGANGNSSSESSEAMIGNYGFQISQSEIDKLRTKAIFAVDEYIVAIDPE